MWMSRYLCGSVRIKCKVYVDVAEAIFVVCHEVRGMFDGFGDKMARIEGIHDGLLEVLVIRFLSKIGQIHTVEKCLVPEIGLVAHLLN